MKKSTSRSSRPVRTVMGRLVQHHSPDKHPEQDDAMADSAYDKTLKQLDSGDVSPENVSDMRKALKGTQVPSPEPAQRLQGWLDAISGRGKK